MSETLFDLYQEMPRYQLPHEAALLADEWWTAKQAASAWGVSERTARRLMEKQGMTLVLVTNVRRDRHRVLRCVRAGTARPNAPRGNPGFADPDYQRQVNEKRWEGHITAAEKKAFWTSVKEAEEAEMVAALTEQARQLIGCPPPIDDDDDDGSHPMPEPEPDNTPWYQRGFLTAGEREAWERKQARKRRGQAPAEEAEE